MSETISLVRCTDKLLATSTTLGQFCADNGIAEPGGIMSTEGYSIAMARNEDQVVIRFPNNRAPYFIPADHYTGHYEIVGEQDV